MLRHLLLGELVGRRLIREDALRIVKHYVTAKRRVL
jgi:hypothetical protein